MTEKIAKFVDQTIWFSYLTVVVVTPLLFSTKNSELFEVPKMLFVYLAATVIFFLTLIKFVFNGKILIPKSLTLASLIVFVAIQVVSTLFSIDKFTSIFGYPTRLNGGLLSQFAYLVIFIGALINLNRKMAKQLIVATIVAALAVSLWGIPAHFGKDPTCFVLTGKLNATCWQKDFDPQLRIFSTLGQPNWLASYLVLILPVSLALFLNTKLPKTKVFFAATTLVLFLAFIFTNSRSAAFGLITALIAFMALLGIKFIRANIKILVLTFGAISIATLVFGNTLILRLNEALSKNLPTGDIGGTESGQIRLIVWQGALEVFRNYPILGSGPETFAYSYYRYRPLAHNNTTEWNFFYNKAHNEFLNYLSNIGFIGTAAYLAFLIAASWTLYRISGQSHNYSASQAESQLKKGSRPALLESNNNPKALLITKAAIAAILGYQVTIFFGFSTVATQVLMYLLIAATLVQGGQNPQVANLANLKGIYQKTAAAFLVIAFLWIGSFVIRLYFADLFASQAKEEQTNLPDSLRSAIETFPSANPFYLADYAYATAVYASSLEDEKLATLLTNQASQSAQESLMLGPNNLINIRRLATSYLLLSTKDPSFESKARELGKRIVELAPTDPQSYLSLAKIQAGTNLDEEAKKTLEIALKLKPDYQEAKELLRKINSTIDN